MAFLLFIGALALLTILTALAEDARPSQPGAAPFSVVHSRPIPSSGWSAAMRARYTSGTLGG